jgi:hypothetical protein
MIGVSGERAFVPKLGVVVTAELAASVADQVGHIRIVVEAESARCRNPSDIIALAIDQRVRCVVTRQEILVWGHD